VLLWSSCNQLDQKSSVGQQTSNHCRKHCWRGIVFQISLASTSHLWLLLRIHWAWIQEDVEWLWSEKKPITTRNPQANAIVKQVLQTIGNIIRTFELHDNYLDEDDPGQGILAATAFAIHATYHTTLQKSPGQLVFGRDMIFNVQHTAKWEYIRTRKQHLFQKNNKRKQKIMLRRTNMRHPLVGLTRYWKSIQMELYVFMLALSWIRLTFVVSNPTTSLQALFMGESAICNFPRREDELITELMNHKRLTSY
jgi:hypothetical protein